MNTPGDVIEHAEDHAATEDKKKKDFLKSVTEHAWDFAETIEDKDEKDAFLMVINPLECEKNEVLTNIGRLMERYDSQITQIENNRHADRCRGLDAEATERAEKKKIVRHARDFVFENRSVFFPNCFK